MIWVLLWTALLTGAGLVLFVVIRSLWRSLLGVLEELDAALSRLDSTRQPQQPPADPPVPALAVFADPAELRARRSTGAPETVDLASDQRHPRHRAE